MQDFAVVLQGFTQWQAGFDIPDTGGVIVGGDEAAAIRAKDYLSTPMCVSHLIGPVFQTELELTRSRAPDLDEAIIRSCVDPPVIRAKTGIRHPP